MSQLKEKVIKVIFHEFSCYGSIFDFRAFLSFLGQLQHRHTMIYEIDIFPRH